MDVHARGDGPVAICTVERWHVEVRLQAGADLSPAAVSARAQQLVHVAVDGDFGARRLHAPPCRRRRAAGWCRRAPSSAAEAAGSSKMGRPWSPCRNAQRGADQACFHALRAWSSTIACISCIACIACN